LITGTANFAMTVFVCVCPVPQWTSSPLWDWMSFAHSALSIVQTLTQLLQFDKYSPDWHMVSLKEDRGCMVFAVFGTEHQQ